MKLNKRQIELVGFIEKCGHVPECQIDKSKYPQSMIDALIAKGILAYNVYTKDLVSTTL